MDDVRRSDGLLGASITLELLAIVQDVAGPLDSGQLVRDFALARSASYSRLQNTILTLSEFSVVGIQDGELVLAPGVGSSKAEWSGHIRRSLASYICSNLVARKQLSAVQYHPLTEELWVDSLLLPGADRGIPTWVADFGVARREFLRSRYWVIDDEFHALFWDVVRTENERQHLSTTVSLEQLLMRQQAQQEAGRRAEEWVLQFERRRLSGHPLLDQIRRVSDDNVNLGFDIMSFSRTGALVHDWFVEVKSYDGDLDFYWSRNEIETARRLGSSYILYLVDRGAIGTLNYEPIIIIDPEKVIFDSTHNTFDAVAYSYRITPKNRSDWR